VNKDFHKYLCLLRHIIMMHFGNGDKPNGGNSV